MRDLDPLRNIMNAISGKEWSKIDSLNGKFAVELPENASISYTYPPETTQKIPGITYFVSDQNGGVAYFVKYEDYSGPIANTNVNPEELREDVVQFFLKSLVDSEVKNYIDGGASIEGLASEFIKIHERHTIKYTGAISKSEGSKNMLEAVIILAGTAVFTISTISRKGCVSNLKRVLDSLEIK